MPSRYVQLPNGKYLEWPEGVSAADFKAKAARVGGLQTVPTTDRGNIRPMTTGERFSATYPIGATGEGIGENLKNIGQNMGQGVAQLIHTLGHPQETAIGLVNSLTPGPTPNPIQALFQSLNTRPAETASQIAGQTIAGGAFGGMAPSMVEGEAAATRGVQSFLDPLKSYRSPLIPESEAIARRSTEILRPHPLEVRGMQRSLGETTPDIASASGGKVRNPLEYAKYANQAGDRLTQFYQDQFIKPNESAPAGSGTVGTVYSRLGKINDELRPIYKTRLMGEQMTKEVQDHMANLERERDLLNNVLYDTLSKRTGVPREKIQEINQRGAMLKSVADNADAAQALRRMGYGGFSESGIPLPLGNIGKVMELMKYLRGGPESVAGRQLSRLLKMSEGGPTDLPSPTVIQDNLRQFIQEQEARSGANRAGSSARKPEGLGPTEPPQAQVVEPGGELEAFSQRRAQQRTHQERLRKAEELQRAREAEQLERNQATKGQRLKVEMFKKLMNQELPRQ